MTSGFSLLSGRVKFAYSPPAGSKISRDKVFLVLVAGRYGRLQSFANATPHGIDPLFRSLRGDIAAPHRDIIGIIGIFNSVPKSVFSYQMEQEALIKHWGCLIRSTAIHKQLKGAKNRMDPLCPSIYFLDGQAASSI